MSRAGARSYRAWSRAGARSYTCDLATAKIACFVAPMHVARWGALLQGLVAVLQGLVARWGALVQGLVARWGALLQGLVMRWGALLHL